MNGLRGFSVSFKRTFDLWSLKQNAPKLNFMHKGKTLAAVPYIES